MMEFGKMALCAITGALLVAALSGCGESARSKANAERNAQKEAEYEGISPSTSATPSFMPIYSGKILVKAGK